jgi:hypothetical protein
LPAKPVKPDLNDKNEEARAGGADQEMARTGT